MRLYGSLQPLVVALKSWRSDKLFAYFQAPTFLQIQWKTHKRVTVTAMRILEGVFNDEVPSNFISCSTKYLLLPHIEKK